jgi:hypothetical protein
MLPDWSNRLQRRLIRPASCKCRLSTPFNDLMQLLFAEVGGRRTIGPMFRQIMLYIRRLYKVYPTPMPTPKTMPQKGQKMPQ